MIRYLDISQAPKTDRSKLQGEEFRDVREELDSLAFLIVRT